MEKYITFSKDLKTFSVTTKDTARAMISMGNPEDHNRAVKVMNLEELRRTFVAAGFREV